MLPQGFSECGAEPRPRAGRFFGLCRRHAGEKPAQGSGGQRHFSRPGDRTARDVLGADGSALDAGRPFDLVQLLRRQAVLDQPQHLLVESDQADVQAGGPARGLQPDRGRLRPGPAPGHGGPRSRKTHRPRQERARRGARECGSHAQPPRRERSEKDGRVSRVGAQRREARDQGVRRHGRPGLHARRTAVAHRRLRTRRSAAPRPTTRATTPT